MNKYSTIFAIQGIETRQNNASLKETFWKKINVMYEEVILKEIKI